MIKNDIINTIMSFVKEILACLQNTRPLSSVCYISFIKLCLKSFKKIWPTSQLLGKDRKPTSSYVLAIPSCYDPLDMVMKYVSEIINIYNPLSSLIIL